MSHPDDSPSLPLLGYAVACYVAWIGYGSLFPLAGWGSSGLTPWAFLSAGLPRYWTVMDLASNVALYFPLGFFGLLWALRSSQPSLRWALWLVVVVVGSGLSLGIEVLQNWLPTRVASNLDWVANTLGVMGGGVLAVAYQRHGSGWMSSLWFRVFRADQVWGACWLMLWATAQLTPELPLFQSGWPGGVAGLIGSGSTTYRFAGEVVVTALNTLAAGLLATQVLKAGPRGPWEGLFLGGLLVVLGKAVFSAAALGFPMAFVWLSNGVLWGIAGGLLATPVVRWVSGARLRIMLAGCLVAGGLLGTVIPPSPYAVEVGYAMQYSALRNLSGALCLLGLIWPLAVLSGMHRWGGRWGDHS